MTAIGAIVGLALCLRLVLTEARRVHASTVLPGSESDAGTPASVMDRLGATDVILWIAAMALLIPRLFGLMT